MGQTERMGNPGVCPNCGAELPPKARACPECGSDERTGWSEEADTGALGLPDEEFDYEAFVRQEFEGEERGGPPRWAKWAAAVVLAAFLAWWLWR